MPWLSIIMAIIAALVSLKSKPKDTGRAVAAAALGGLGTYYVTHETEWGRDLLGDLDGVVPVISDADAATGQTLPDGSKIPAGTTTIPSGTTGGATSGKTVGIWDTLTSWGPTGTAAVIGTTTVAADSGTRKYIPWIAAGVLAFLILK